MQRFRLAKPIFPSSLLKKRNVSLYFYIDFLKFDSPIFNISGKNEYQIFLNGKLIGYGPSKGAKGYCRIDQYKLKNLEEKNRLLIILSSYNCVSFDRIKETPFIQYELLSKEKIIHYSSINDYCYLNKNRYQKVARYSYQRNFMESYHFDDDFDIYHYGQNIPNKLNDLVNINEDKYLKGIKLPNLKPIPFKFKQRGEFEEIIQPPYESRFTTLKELDIFDKSEWEINPIDKVRSFKIKNCDTTYSNYLDEYKYQLYELKDNKTGFLSLKIEVIKPCDLYIYFSELLSRDNKELVNPFRNDTIDIIYYKLERGYYNLTSFSPYTFRVLMFAVTRGEIRINDIGLIKLEREYKKFKYRFEDKKIARIFSAAISSLAQNSIDILTDCPSRERAGWLCDSYFSSRSEKLLTSKNIIEKNFLENYALYKNNGEIDKGMVPMCYPSDSMQRTYIPNWAMFYVVELADYLKRNGNDEIILKSKRNIISLLSFFEKYEDNYSLLNNLPSWVFIEWSHINDIDVVSDINIASNALYYAFLKSAGVILNDDLLIDKANNIKNILNKYAYNGKYFVDKLINKNNQLIQYDHISETTQYYMCYFDVNEHEDLLKRMLIEFGPRNKTDSHISESAVFIGNYLRLELLNRNRLYEKTLEETVDYFYNMAKLTGTLWEHASTSASLVHGFTSFIINIVFEAITGISKIDYLNNIIYISKTSYKKKYIIRIPLGNDYLLITEKGIIHSPKNYQIIYS